MKLSRFRQGLVAASYVAILCISSIAKAHAESATVAVASNFMAPMKVIASEFEEATGHKVNLVFGSSGKLYAQIINGAPFQLFLSADQSKPSKLIETGKHDAQYRFTYAIGKLALVSDTLFGDVASQSPANPKQQVESNQFDRIAIANPRVAPYGKAATEVLDYFDLGDAINSKIVQGENIAQVYQFVSSGNVSLGFVALSQVRSQARSQMGSSATDNPQNLLDSNRVWVVPANLHTPIKQDMLLLKSGESNEAAIGLYHWIKSADMQLLIESFGYETVSDSAASEREVAREGESSK